MVGGYSLRFIKSTILGFDEMPAWFRWIWWFDCWWSEFDCSRHHLQHSLVYCFCHFHHIGLGEFDLSFASSSSQIIIAMVAFFISIVFIPAGGNMAYEEKFKAAFDIKRIFDFYKKNIGWTRYLHICYL